MIKNKHETYVRSVPEIIRNVIVEGSHTLSEEESLHLNRGKFFNEYEAFMQDMNFPPVPLAVMNTGEGETLILPDPKFHMRLDTMFGHAEFEAYQYLFGKRYDEWKEERENSAEEKGALGEFQENKIGDKTSRNKNAAKKFFEEEGTAELEAARQKNADFAAIHVYALFDDDQGGFPDEYGWIENRPALFFEAVDKVCDHYALPRLEIGISEDNEVYFDAPEQQIETLKELYRERKEKLAALFEKLGDEENPVINVKKLAHGAMQGAWKIENVGLGLDAQQRTYTETFMRNSHDLVSQGGGRNTVNGEKELRRLMVTNVDFPKPILN